ncbi:hypothetical protein BWI96_09800 [Siphonobacter sp. SORGH_AS_0500]|nr:hypothetical protein [Siphonobacter sp. SORGH_AS_1065]MDR6193196.1 hypothetical protein [Siphonobacter sp. SORGH_AS_0500]PKK36668.1 hypothetical protein BWI96_09800 [Siphonobacter sp. SORGH_AS_0500]
MISAPVSYINFDSTQVARTTKKIAKAKKPVKYDRLNTLVWFVALPMGALLWVTFITWLVSIIF